VIWREGDGDTEIPESDYVLVIGKENILFTKESLKRMVNSITSKVGVVIPETFFQFKLDAMPTIYTLCDKEKKLDLSIFSRAD